MRVSCARLCAAAIAFLLFVSLGFAQSTLRVYVIDVDQGSSTLIVGPTGKTMLIDGGPDQSGWKSSPSGPGPIAQLLASLGIAQLDATLLTHYHSDHYEGLTELAQHNYLKPTAKAYDRGNSPAPENGFTTAINTYLSAMGTKRTTINLGQVVDLGGGASVQCMVKAGAIFGGPTINTASSDQVENSNSIAVRITYGNFEMYVGGDLTGGGGGTTDVEGPAGPFVGDVDVYVADHHGSSTSSDPAFLAATLPEVVIASCGLHNSYGHPSTSAINDINKASRSVLFYSTSGGADGDGFGNRGFVNGGGTVKVETNGLLYLVTPAIGPVQKVACDEIASSYAGPSAGDLRITEFMADPSAGAVPDDAGEWFEVTNVCGSERNLAGLKFSNASNGEQITFATPVLLKPGGKFVIGNCGDSQRSGYMAVHCEPYNVFTLGNSGDSIRIRNASNGVVDEVAFTAAWADSVGVAAQKTNALGSNLISNWIAATATYGFGDKGTPGATNTADATTYPIQFVSQNVPIVGGLWDVNFAALGRGGAIAVGVLSESTAAPFLNIEGQILPLTIDSLMEGSLGIPGFVTFLDADGFSQANVVVPNDPSFHGYSFFGCVGIYDWPSIAPLGVSPVVPVFVP